MSIILVKKEKNKISIGSDSQESYGENIQENILNCKLRKISDNIHIAGAGNAHVCSLFFAFAEKHSEELLEITGSYDLVKYFNEFSKFIKELSEDLGSENIAPLVSAQFILVINSTVWYFNNFYIREILENESSAIGSGIQPALACLTFTKSIDEVLKAVCKVDIYCSEPTKVIEINI